MIDILIIGSGAAGLSAALNAKENNNVTVISKTYPTHSQTCQAQGGINAVLYEENDSIQTHIEDTYNASKELSNKEHIKFMCENAKETINWLDKLGVPFNRNSKGNIAQRKFGGTKKIRTCYSSDYTGLKILHTLYDNCIKNDIKFLNEYLVLKILCENDKANAVLVLNIQSGEIQVINAKTIIIATGGYAGIYTNHTTNSYSTTGDGLMLAVNAGVELSNLEFIQFHPTALKSNNLLISESARGEGGYLIDKDGNRFIDELKARDIVARAIYDKVKNEEDVYLDLRHLGKEKIRNLMPQEYELAKLFSNKELDKELLEIKPAAHYSMGGIKTDINCKSNIENLYACGECAQNDIHGANRLGGNSLLEIVFFGKVAGKNAKNKAKETELTNKDYTKEILAYKEKIDSIFDKEIDNSFYKIKNDIGDLLFKNVGLYRNKKDLEIAYKKLEELEADYKNSGIKDKSKIYNKNLLDYLELENIINLSKLITRSALKREESRGSHYRTDYAKIEKSFCKNSIVKNNIISFREIK